MSKKLIRDLCQSFKDCEPSERISFNVDGNILFAETQSRSGQVQFRVGVSPPSYVRMQTIITKKLSGIEVDWPKNTTVRDFLISVLRELDFKLDI